MNIKTWLSQRSVHRKGQDVFDRTQRRLMVGYSWQIIFFLILFIMAVYAVLYIVIFQIQQRELRSMVKQEARVIENYIEQNNSIWQTNQQVVIAGVEQFFYYVVDPSGQILSGHENIPLLRDDILKMLQNTNLQGNSVAQYTLQFERKILERRQHNQNERALFLKPIDNEIRLMFMQSPIMYEGQIVGTLYAGKDVTPIYGLMKWTLMILVALASLFFIIALFLSNYMSKKAMIPIRDAFTRQREFVADASHELRTPLSVIQSSLDAMEMAIDLDEEDNFARKLFFNMKDEVRRMTNLVGDLLTLARSDSGKFDLNIEQFDLKSVAEKVLDSVQALASQKHIQLHLDAPETLVVKGDCERLRQLLYILLDNAIKYTLDDGKVYVFLETMQRDLVMKVRDTGIGIKSEEQPLIFERFYRADKARSRQMGSFGLGLSIAKWIVDLHHGTIQVDSEVGIGSTFTVIIPLKEQMGE